MQNGKQQNSSGEDTLGGCRPPENQVAETKEFNVTNVQSASELSPMPRFSRFILTVTRERLQIELRTSRVIHPFLSVQGGWRPVLPWKFRESPCFPSFFASQFRYATDRVQVSSRTKLTNHLTNKQTNIISPLRLKSRRILFGWAERMRKLSER